jgi:hypothetical protein
VTANPGGANRGDPRPPRTQRRHAACAIRQRAG